MTELRWLPTLDAAGPTQMALDGALLESAARGHAAFRFYRWTEPTLSLGYFQSGNERRESPLASLAWVRRASGGAAILHHPAGDLTYSFALPAAAAARPDGESWICRVHAAIRECLAARGVRARAVVCGEEQLLGPFLCFLHHTVGDLVLGGSKIVGSAQRKSHGAILQHGTILLAGYPLTPQLPGIAELSGIRLADAELAAELPAVLARRENWRFVPDDWTADERAAAQRLRREKFDSRDWNERR